MRIFGLFAMTSLSRWGSIRTESSHPMDANIALISGLAKASLISFALSAGLFARNSCDARAVGYSTIFNQRVCSVRRPFSYIHGKTLGHAHEGETIATVSPALSREDLM